MLSIQCSLLFVGLSLGRIDLSIGQSVIYLFSNLLIYPKFGSGGGGNLSGAEGFAY